MLLELQARYREDHSEQFPPTPHHGQGHPVDYLPVLLGILCGASALRISRPGKTRTSGSVIRLRNLELNPESIVGLNEVENPAIDPALHVSSLLGKMKIKA